MAWKQILKRRNQLKGVMRYTYKPYIGTLQIRFCFHSDLIDGNSFLIFMDQDYPNKILIKKDVNCTGYKSHKKGDAKYIIFSVKCEKEKLNSESVEYSLTEDGDLLIHDMKVF